MASRSRDGNVISCVVDVAVFVKPWDQVKILTNRIKPGYSYLMVVRLL